MQVARLACLPSHRTIARHTSISRCGTTITNLTGRARMTMYACCAGVVELCELRGGDAWGCPGMVLRPAIVWPSHPSTLP